MAFEVATLVARLEADVRDFERGMQTAERRLGTLEGESKKATNGLRNMVATGAKFAAVAATGLGLNELRKFMGNSVTAASDLNESINAVSVVFGDAASTVLEFSSDTTDAVFAVESAVNQMATTTGAMLINFGLSQQEAADTTVMLTERAADLASVFNTEVEEALAAVNAALRGEQEPIRRFGVSMDGAALKAKAFELGLADANGEIGRNEKALAAVQLLMEQTSAVQGDAAATAGEYANQQRQLSEQTANLQVAVGQVLVPALSALLPIVIDVVQGLTGFVSIIEKIPGITSDTEREVASLASAFEELERQADIAAIRQLLSPGDIRGLREAGISVADLADAVALARRDAAAGGLAFNELSREIEGANKWAFAGGNIIDQLNGKMFVLEEAALDVGAAIRVENDALADHVVAVTAADLGYSDLTDATGDAVDAIGKAPDVVRKATDANLRWMIGAKDLGKSLEELKADFEAWEREVTEAAAASEAALRTSVGGIIDLFAKAPPKIKTSVDQMIAHVESQREMATAFEANMRVLMAAGLDAVVEELEKAGPAAVDQAAALAGDMNSAFALEIGLQAILGGEVSDLETRAATLQGRLKALGLTMAEAIAAGFSAVSLSISDPFIDTGGGGSIDLGFTTGFQEGGVIPGPIGAPVPVLAHGGEIVTNPHRASALQPSDLGGGGGTTVVQLVVNDRIAQEIVVAGNRSATRTGTLT